MLTNNCKFELTEACERAFEELTDKLSTYSVLRPPDWDKPFNVFCNASNVAVGSALCWSTGEKGKTDSLPMLVSNRHRLREIILPQRGSAWPWCFRSRSFVIILHVIRFFFVDHMAINYLVNKVEQSGRLAGWSCCWLISLERKVIFFYFIG